MVILVVLVTLCVASLGGGLALLSQTEAAIAGAQARTVQTGYAADAAARLAMAAIGTAPVSPAWPRVGALPGLTSAAPMMAIGPGAVMDVEARTDELNREAARRWPAGPDTPVWRLMGWGRLPIAGEQPVPHVAVWVADDVWDADADPGTDHNGVLMVRAEAVGVAGASRAVLLRIVRSASGVNLVSWRED